MSVFIDTGVFYAHHDTDADRHDAAVSAFDEVLDGSYGQPYTNDYVLDEAVTLTRVRAGSFEAANAVSRRILGEGSYPDAIEVIHVQPDDVREGLKTFRRYDDHDLSFTDAVILVTCERRDVDAVLSFDGDFDGLVDRIEP